MRGTRKQDHDWAKTKPDDARERMPVSEIKSVMRRVIKQAGLPSEFLYAFEKTGRLVTEENRSQLTAQDIAEWEAAIEEYRAKHS